MSKPWERDSNFLFLYRPIHANEVMICASLTDGSCLRGNFPFPWESYCFWNPNYPNPKAF